MRERKEEQHSRKKQEIEIAGVGILGIWYVVFLRACIVSLSLSIPFSYFQAFRGDSLFKSTLVVYGRRGAKAYNAPHPASFEDFLFKHCIDDLSPSPIIYLMALGAPFRFVRNMRALVAFSAC